MNCWGPNQQANGEREPGWHPSSWQVPRHSRHLPEESFQPPGEEREAAPCRTHMPVYRQERGHCGKVAQTRAFTEGREGRRQGQGAPAPYRQVLVCIFPPGLWASVDRRQLNLFCPWSTKDARKMFVLFHWGYISGLAAAEFVCVILHKLFDLRWQKQHTQGFLLRDCHCEQVGPAQGDPSQFLSVLWTILKWQPLPRWYKLLIGVCAQSCLTLCDPVDCSPPDSAVHGIFQGRTLEWVAISYSKLPVGCPPCVLHCG